MPHPHALEPEAPPGSVGPPAWIRAAAGSRRSRATAPRPGAAPDSSRTPAPALLGQGQHLLAREALEVPDARRLDHLGQQERGQESRRQGEPRWYSRTAARVAAARLQPRADSWREGWAIGCPSGRDSTWPLRSSVGTLS